MFFFLNYGVTDTPEMCFDACGLTKRGFLNANLVNSKCKVFTIEHDGKRMFGNQAILFACSSVGVS